MAMVKMQKKTRYAGLATVEAALIFPLLLLLTFGIIQYGWLFLKAQQITNAARNGARVGITHNTDLVQLSGQVSTTISTLMGQAGIEGYSEDISDLGVGKGDVVTVSVTVPGVNVTLLNISFLPIPENIGSTVTMAKEGP